MKSLLATSLAKTMPEQTIIRVCSSSMQAVHTAAQEILSGKGGFYINGGAT